MRTLLLMRHAKSDWGAPALADFDRPLNARGEQDALRMGRWMVEQGVTPQQIMCSTALRAQQTLQGLNAALALPAEHIDFTERLYLADLPTLQKLLSGYSPVSGPLMLIGHNPGLDELLMQLCGSDLPLTDKGQLLTTANLAQIRLPDDWQPLASHVGSLQHLMRPKALDR